MKYIKKVIALNIFIQLPINTLELATLRFFGLQKKQDIHTKTIRNGLISNVLEQFVINSNNKNE